MLPDSTNPRVMADNIRRLQIEVENAIELPSVETTDEGKVLTVDSNGKWAAEEPVEELPSVTTTDEGKVLTVNSSGNWAKGNPIVGNLDYSTTEQDTGVKWVDGKTIYRKTVVMEEPIVSTDSVNISTNVDKVIHLNGIMRRVKTDDTGDKIFFDLSDYLSTTNHNAVTCELTTNGVLSFKVIFTIAETFKISLVIANIYYTKNDVTETKSTKRKTTKGEN